MDIFIGARKVFIKFKISGEKSALDKMEEQESQKGGFFKHWGVGSSIVDLYFSIRLPGDPISLFEDGGAIEKTDNSIVGKFFATNSIDTGYLRKVFEKYPELDFEFKAFAQSEPIIDCSCKKGVFSYRNYVAERNELFDKFSKVELDEEFPQFGTFTDSRDGQTYKTVKIGCDEWLAENFRFKVDGEMNGFYTYEAARNAVPEGWHIPSQHEFEALVIAANNFKLIACAANGLPIDTFGDHVGAALKSKNFCRGDYKGYDFIGFNALPAGFMYAGEDFVTNEGCTAAYWTSTENTRVSCSNDFFEEHIGNVVSYHLEDDSDCFYPVSRFDKSRLSLRLVKNRELTESEKKKQNRLADVEKSLLKDCVYYVPEYEEGSFTDPRDGQTYKTIIYDGLEILAENLRYKAPGSYSFNDDESKDAEYGRFYTWESLKSAVPDGWEVCSRDDVEDLSIGLCNEGFDGFEGAALKSDDKDWNVYTGIRGINAIKLNFLPLGYRNAVGEFVPWRVACFWTSTEAGEGCAYRYFTHVYSAGLFLEPGLKDEAYSVRIVRRLVKPYPFK